MSLIYRTAGAWGAGKGSDLAPSEVDSNFYQLMQSIAAKAVQGVGIDHFRVAGNEMTVVLTDGTNVGPYALPVATISFAGTWAPSVAYFANQIFTYGGSTYIVLINHTSATTFDPGANDGSGHPYYGLLLSNPSSALPIGGAVGAVLTKSSTADFVTLWQLPTLADLSDVLPSPGPLTGQLVYWNGSAFSYLPQASVHGAAGSFKSLTDVLASPGPVNGDLVTCIGGGLFSYIPQSAVGGGGSATLVGLTDVLASPAPEARQLVYSVDGTNFSYLNPTTAMLQDVGLGWYTAVQKNDVLTFNPLAGAAGMWVNQQPYAYRYFNNTGTYTLTLNELSCFLDVPTSSTGNTLEIDIPLHATTPSPLGSFFSVRQNGEFRVTIAGLSGVTLVIPPGKVARTRKWGAVLFVQQTATADTWAVSGDLDDAVNVWPATGGSLDARNSGSDICTWTPTANATMNNASSSVQVGRQLQTIITTSGTTSFTLTFGTGFKSQGTLATGTVTGKVFVVSFIGDGTNFNEISRTTAM